MYVQMMYLDLKLTPPLMCFKSFHDSVLRWEQTRAEDTCGAAGSGVQEDSGSLGGFGTASGSASNWS